MSSYNDVHRLFLQSIMSHRVLAEHSAVAKLQKVYDALEQEVEGILDVVHLKKVIRQINDRIKPLNMEIRIEVSESSSENFVLLVNTVSTPINLTMAKYTEKERCIFKKIVDEIVGSDTGIVSSIACLNMCDELQLSKADQESLIRRFVDDLWLVDDEGKLCLSVRSISELTPFLRSAYKDYLLNCALCKELVFQGFRCQKCPTICHRHCVTKYAKRSANLTNVKCPNPDCNVILENLGLFVTMDEVEEPVNEIERDPSPPRKKSRQQRH